MRKRLAIVVVMVAAFSLPTAPSAPASHGKDCGIVSAGSRDYRVSARAMSCRSARKWTGRFLREGSRPRGYTCVNPAGSIRVYCSRASRSYWATRI